MIYVNTILLVELLMYGIVYLVLLSADSVNCFKNRLDKFWKNQDIIYNYQADIHGTGNRSEVVL